MRKFSYARSCSLVLAIALTGGVAVANDPAAPMIGTAAPSFRLTDVLSGKTMSLEDMRGKTVVLHFGASW